MTKIRTLVVRTDPRSTKLLFFFHRYTHAFCFSANCCTNSLLGAKNVKSPWIAASLFASGVHAFWVPVSNGEPSVTLSGYNVKSLSSSEEVACGK